MLVYIAKSVFDSDQLRELEKSGIEIPKDQASNVIILAKRVEHEPSITWSELSYDPGTTVITLKDNKVVSIYDSERFTVENE